MLGPPRKVPPTHPYRVVQISLVGHLTSAALERSFESIAAEVATLPEGRSFDLVVDALAMTGYDADARSRFVEWNASNKERIRRVAIVTDKVLWHMVIAAMSVASGQKMRGLATQALAREWLAQETR